MQKHLIVFLTTGLFSHCALAQTRYSVSDLGPTGSVSSGVYGINPNGEVVGTSELACFCGTHAYRYMAGSILDLTTLGGADSTATAINGNGIIVGHSRMPGDVAIHAFLWSAGKMTDLGTLGGKDSFARAVNDSGQVVGYSDTTGNRRAFLYSGGAMSDLGSLGGRFSEADAISSNGLVAGVAAVRGDSSVHAFLYRDRTFSDLGTLGGSTSAATAINSKGQVAGYSNTAADAGVHAFLFTDGALHDLGSLGGDYSMARAMDESGNVVGMTSSGAFLYSNGAMVDLNTLIDPASGWKLEDATGINARGQIIGYGSKAGQTHAFLLDPSAKQPDAQDGLTGSTPIEVTGASAGIINYEKYEYPIFNTYTENPTYTQRQWLNDHFYRMSVFSPYFDKSLMWFHKAVAYIISYGIPLASPLVQQHPEWILHDAAGNLLYIPFDCINDACPHYAADISSSAYRAQWIANAQTVLAHGYQGIWVDDVNFDLLVSGGHFNPIPPIDQSTGQNMTLDAWRSYFATFMEQMRYSMPGALLETNSIWYSDTEGVRDANPYIERQIAAADILHIERGIGSDPGLHGGTGLWGVATIMNYIDRAHARQKAVTLQDAIIDVTNQEYSAAAYFMISAGRDATGDNTATPDNWWPGYDINLGTPSAPRIYYTGVFQRKFEKGMVLMNDPNAPSTTIYLDGVYTRPDGTSNTSVVLGGKEGALLTRVGPLPGGRFLSDLNWLSATNGWMDVQRDATARGNPLSLNNNRYLKGLGVNSNSTIHYKLAGACSSFTATVGIDDEVPAGTGHADFQVLADGVARFDSGQMTGGNAAKAVRVDLTGVQDLALVVSDGGLGTGNSHADWAGAFLGCSSF